MYTYPIDFDLFNSEEVIIIIDFLSLIEDINEKQKIDKNLVLKKYSVYRKLINSVSLEKKMDRDFLKVSGYSIYNTIKKLQ